MTDTTVAEPSPVEAPLEALAPVPHDRFPCFDGLRAMAAFAVLVYHVTTTYNLETLHSDTWQWTQRLGNFGVSTFFLISGFLLYRPFVVAVFTDRPPPKLVPFWGRRALRIYPAYWVAITVAAYGMAIITISNFQIFFSTYLLLQNYRAGLTLAGLGVEWTLVIEVSFYIALPFIAWFLRSIDRPGASARARSCGRNCSGSPASTPSRWSCASGGCGRSTPSPHAAAAGSRSRRWGSGSPATSTGSRSACCSRSAARGSHAAGRSRCSPGRSRGTRRRRGCCRPRASGSRCSSTPRRASTRRSRGCRTSASRSSTASSRSS